MGAQQAAVKPTQEDSTSALNAFNFLLLCSRLRSMFIFLNSLQIWGLAPLRSPELLGILTHVYKKSPSPWSVSLT